jgi:hypothetical protein
MLTWRELNKQLLSLTEEEVLELLNREREGSARATILTRLHQRYSVLRSARERMSLLKGAEAP